ncbi:hypothetical protein D083_3711 [Dickeya solani RNS 08.23.3.1.A]|nr:hypothetical protein D083_3711 [Dickeya solani RNS 08.23.3.1.A]
MGKIDYRKSMYRFSGITTISEYYFTLVLIFRFHYVALNNVLKRNY